MGIDQIIEAIERAKRDASREALRESVADGELVHFDNIGQIKRLMVAMGSHWWDDSSMRYFNTKVYGPVYAGRYFVTSERDGSPYDVAAWDGARRYTIRECVNGDLETIGEFGQYPTLASARRAAAAISPAAAVIA